MNYKKIKKRIYQIIEKADNGDKASRIFDYFIIALIFLNITAIIVESFEGYCDTYSDYLRLFEIFSIFVFSIEYLLRLWTSNFKFDNKPILRYIFTPMAIIDLLAILPFYLPILIPFDLRFVRVLRVLRMLRVFKLNRYSNALVIINKVIKEKKEELIVTVFITFLLLLMASTLMFYIEHDVQPKAFPNIISSFWWAIATLTTVGYGDVYPITGWGRLLSGIIAILGIGLVALPTGIISSGFMNEISINNKNDENDSISYCPYCGKRIKD
jgi:voltage-gated potassium channel